MVEPKPNNAEQSPEKRISALRRERDAIRRLLQQGALTRVERELESQIEFYKDAGLEWE